MNRRRLVLVLIAILAIVGIAAGGWALFLRPVGVQVLTAQRDVPVQVFGLGTVEARVVSKVGFKVPGVLVELHADQGDRVAKGEVLARLDAREQAARVDRAQAGIMQADANLQRAIAGVTKAQATLANAKSVNERRQSLVKQHTVSVEAADAARAAFDIARADVTLADSEVQVARAATVDARAQLLLEKTTLDLHTLAAPYDALVVARQKELGAVLAPGEPVFTLIDPQTVWVLAYIDESKAGGIAVGQKAEIVLRSRPDHRYKGRVARIEIESDRVNEERRIEVAFDALPADFHLGEQAEVYITTGRIERALLAPEAAIDGLGNGRGTVWTVEDGRLERRAVTLGRRLLDGRNEITGGIPDGVSVVSPLRPGLRVGRSATILTGVRP